VTRKDRRPHLYGAIDLGGTNVRAIVADLDGNIAGEDIRESRAGEGLESVLRTMQDTLSAALAAGGVALADLQAVGIASPGAVDVVRGVVPAAPQLRGWKNVPLVRLMRERLGRPVYLANDATAAALGENKFGAGRGSRHMLFLTVSTGIGGGIIIDGKAYEGANGSAGEMGHIVIDMDGPECGCGGRGCLEALASGPAMARRGAAAVAAGEAPVLAGLSRREGLVTAEMMSRAAAGGDEFSRGVFRDTGRYLGVALASYVNIFNPEVILIGGGVARAAELFMPIAEQTMRELAMSEPLKHVRLGLGALADRAGSLGMIARLREELTG
jgi:glucokinase